MFNNDIAIIDVKIKSYNLLTSYFFGFLYFYSKLITEDTTVQKMCKYIYWLKKKKKIKLYKI